MNICQLIAKVAASMPVGSMFGCNKSHLAEGNEIIFQLQHSSHTDT